MARLGRVLDPSALDEGTRALVSVRVPRAWLAAPCTVELDVPARLPCARCDAGGCDACGRSGAYRLTQAARVTVHLPARAGADAFVVRVSRPLEDEPLALLHVEVRPGDAASPNVRRAGPAAAAPTGSRAFAYAALALLLVAAALLSLQLR